MILIQVKSRQVTSSHGFAFAHFPRQTYHCGNQTARSLARQPGEQRAARARYARGVFPLDMIPLVLPDPAKARPAPGSHPVGVAGTDQIVRRAAA